MDSFVELGTFDRYVLAHWLTHVDSWLERGFVRVPEERILGAVFAAIRNLRDVDVPRVWKRVLGSEAPVGAALWDLQDEIVFRCHDGVGAVVVLERVIERGLPNDRPFKRVEPEKPRPLSELAKSLSLVLVDEWGNPYSKASYALIVSDGSTHDGTFNALGESLQSNLPSGSAELSLVDKVADSWALRAGDGYGWLRSGVSVRLVDELGQPLGNADFRVVFANGAVLVGKLDGSGSARIEATPSYPMRVEFPAFDIETWE